MGGTGLSFNLNEEYHPGIEIFFKVKTIHLTKSRSVIIIYINPIEIVGINLVQKLFIDPVEERFIEYEIARDYLLLRLFTKEMDNYGTPL